MSRSSKSSELSSTTASSPSTGDKDSNLFSTGQSFSSPYTVQTLDRIPTPLLKLLVVLGPTLHHAAKLTQILMWNSPQPRQSVLFVLFYISACLWTWQVLAFGMPLLILYKLAQDWLLLRTSRSKREALEQLRQQKRQQQQQQKRASHHHEEEEDDDDDERIRQLRLQQQKEEEQELLISRKIRPEGQVSLDDTLQDLAVVNTFIDHVCYNVKTVLVHIDGTRSDTAVSVLSVLMYCWPVWVMVCWCAGAGSVMALVGALLLVSPSPQFNVIMLAVRNNVVLKHVLAAAWAYGVALITTVFATITFSGNKSTVSVKQTKFQTIKQWWNIFKSRVKKSKENAMNVIQVNTNNTDDTLVLQKGGTRSEMIFQFEVYENQRWWLGVNWTTNMMPSERGAWTDNQLKAIPSKEKFELPEATVKTREMKMNDDDITVVQRVTTNKVWSWADADWWVDMTGEVAGKVDQNGWEYGNNAWKQLGGTPGLQTFTRRRRWCRRAKLVEREIEDQVDKKNK